MTPNVADVLFLKFPTFSHIFPFYPTLPHYATRKLSTVPLSTQRPSLALFPYLEKNFVTNLQNNVCNKFISNIFEKTLLFLLKIYFMACTLTDAIIVVM
jgi:hypothetical protein